MGKYRGNLQSISWFCCYNSDFQPLKLVLKMPLLVLKMPWPTIAMTPEWGSLVSWLALHLQSWGLLSLLVSSIKTSVFPSVWVGQQWEGSLSHEGVTVNKEDFTGTVLRGVDHWLPVHPSAWDDCSGSKTFCEMQIIELYEFICLAELQNLGKYFCFEWIWKKAPKIKQKKKKKWKHLILKLANLYILLNFPMIFQPKQTDESADMCRHVLGVLHPFQQLKTWPRVCKPWRPWTRMHGEAGCAQLVGLHRVVGQWLSVSGASFSKKSQKGVKERLAQSLCYCRGYPC